MDSFVAAQHARDTYARDGASDRNGAHAIAYNTRDGAPHVERALSERSFQISSRAGAPSK
jgi:hypothetical protein